MEEVPLVACMAGDHMSCSRQEPEARGSVALNAALVFCLVMLQFTCAQFRGFMDYIIWF